VSDDLFQLLADSIPVILSASISWITGFMTS
jgi:hypothetical protein